MSDVMTRKALITSMAAAGGGLLLAVTCGTPLRAAGPTPAPTPSPRETLAAYLEITPGGEFVVTVPASEMGQGTTTALPMILAEELDAPWQRVRFVQAAPVPVYGPMVTEASATTAEYFRVLRKIGATARAMLIGAAAQRWGVAPAECTTSSGEVLHRASGRRLPYGALAATAAALPVPTDVALKPASQFELIGRPTTFLEIARKVDGSAVYGLDVRVPDMLVGAIRHCPRYGSRVGTIDVSPAKRLPGVHDVIVLDDAVVAVADNYWHARRAVDAVDLVTTGGIEADDASVARAFDEALARAGETGKGSAVDPFAGTKPQFEAVFRFPYLAHATMEPMNCTASVRDGACEIWAPTQGRRVAQDVAARITGLPAERVHVHTTYLGGGFGRRSNNDFVEKAVLVAMRVGRPVKIVWSREEDVTHDWYRPAMAVHVRASTHGHAVRLDAHVAGPSILAAWGPERFGNIRFDDNAVDGLLGTPYQFAALRGQYSRVEPGVPIWWWRSVSNSHNTYVLEYTLDELARRSRLDPIDLRIGLLRDNAQARAVLQRAVAMARNKRERGTSLGACFVRMRGTSLAAVAEVSMPSRDRVRLHRISCAVHCGLVVNPQAAEAQIQGGIVWGLSGIVWGEVSIRDGAAVQRNFNAYPVARIGHIPPTDVEFLSGGASPGGLGEVGAGVIPPALANAIRAAGGPPLLHLPFVRNGIALA